ncbi:MAG TPA: hemerythrin domain-containing protein [Rubrivivax sp.]|nr:hemerythrin domain-containing protein [Rubrivivax sp.]HRY86622.1 hemerythrin domain-containing protein [Rubrivivax sp.]HRZ59414.1 hemerythrin domain-containing protein [Rubrivivax sp.]
MNLPFPGVGGPDASFEVPLEMLAACHGRIEKQCRTLERLAGHLPRHGADAAAQEAAAAVLRYFDTAAVHHHEDEEQDLFPALLESMAGSDPVCLRELTGALLADHQRIGAAWQHLRPGLAAVAAGDAAGFDAAAALQLTAAYRAHIAREEGELLPMAARLLDDAALARIGRAMRARRGVALPD